MDYQSTNIFSVPCKNVGSSYHRGVHTEQQVLEKLEKKGYVCLHQRLRTPFGELDLVCAKEREIMFIEVKYRKSVDAVYYALSPRQRGRIFKAAQWFLDQASFGTYTKSSISVALVSKKMFKWYPDVCLEGYDAF
jgi:putative endonuclease